MASYLTKKQAEAEGSSKKMDVSWEGYNETTVKFKENLSVLDTKMESQIQPQRNIASSLEERDVNFKSINTSTGKINNTLNGMNSELDDDIEKYEDYLNDYEDWLDDHDWAERAEVDDRWN